MEQTVYIAFESTGQYEDHTTNIIACSFDQNKAQSLADEHEKNMWALRDIPFPCSEEVESLLNNSKYDEINEEDWDKISAWQDKVSQGTEFNRVYVEAHDIL